MDYRILVVDDEPAFLDSVKIGLISAGWKKVLLESNAKNAAALFQEDEIQIDLALIDITMPGMNGVELLALVKNTSPDTECIMVTAVNDAKIAVDCLKKGAYDYLVKPISPDDLMRSINQALERKRLLAILDMRKKNYAPQLQSPAAFQKIISRSERVQKILKEAELHALSKVPVLITGESGTGKELLAQAIHLASPRAQLPFTAVNMSSLTSSLFEAEFFGHTKGAFTGADQERVGYLEHTQRGTIFLDEIGDLALELQGKLLRVLQEGEFIKLGTSQLQRVDVRFVAATNTDLEKAINKGSFRKDLFYRLKGAWLHLPPLRERKEDIPILIEKFLAECCDPEHMVNINDSALSVLLDYDYPGNIRELKSIIQSAVNLAGGKTITIRTLPDDLQKLKIIRKAISPDEKIPTLAEREQAQILDVYERTDRNKAQTAKLLDIGLSTLRRKLASYGID
jgi:two-component system response regulator AtoC